MERQIHAYRCRKCGALHYPFRMVCRECGENGPHEFDPVPLPREGTLLTFTFVHNLPAEYEVARLALGVVELSNGLRMLGQLDVAEPTLGMKVVGKVEVVRREAYSSRYGMVFRAA
ncbi:MAG: OB-fold domain-containing protein [Actinomycetota bacterium]